MKYSIVLMTFFSVTVSAQNAGWPLPKKHLTLNHSNKIPEVNTCLKLNIDGKMSKVICKGMAPKDGNQVPACGSIFVKNGTVLWADCWNHQSNYVEDICREGKCEAEAEDGNRPLFCCCRGDLCNERVSVLKAGDEQKQASIVKNLP